MDVTESYRILELEIGASRAAVDTAYCRLVEKWHPDRVPPDDPEALREAQRMVQSINEAYRNLAKISPNTTKSPEPAAPSTTEPGNQATAAGTPKSPTGSGPSVAPPAAPKNKPKLPPLTHAPTSLGQQPPAPPPPPPPDTWAVRPAPPPPTAPPSNKSFPPSAAIVGPPPFAPVAKPPAPAPVPSPEPSTPPPDPTKRKVPGLYDSLFPIESPLRRFAPLILAAIVVFVLLLGKCALSSSKNKTARGPDPKTTGRLLAKSNLTDVTITATRLAAPGDVTSANFTGATDQALAGLPPGNYAIIGHAEGWPDVRSEAAVEAEHTTDVMMNFKGGSLRLDSVPSGATVRMGAVILGHTPLVAPNLPPGARQLSIEYPFWPMSSFNTVISEGVEATGTVRLPHGKLIVETTPSGTIVSLGKRNLGQTPLTIEQFPAGTRKLTLQAKGFPPLEVSIVLEDHGEVKVHPALGTAFPLLDPVALLRSIWVPDNPDQIAPPLEGVTGNFQSKNGVVKNLDRKRLFEVWMNKRYRFTGTIKSYDQANSRIEFAEQSSDLSKYRLLAALSNEARNDPDLIAQLTKGTTLTFYGRLTAVEEPRWPSKVITFEFLSADPLR